MKYLASLVLSLFVVAVVGSEEKKEALDPAKLVGDWTYVSGVKAGEKVAKDTLAAKVTFNKDTVFVPVAGTDMKFTMAFKIDAKESPATIDMDIKDGPVKEGKALGIIAIDGDDMKLCYTFEGAKRPTKFESTKENKAHYFVLKRAK